MLFRPLKIFYMFRARLVRVFKQKFSVFWVEKSVEMHIMLFNN